MYYREVKIRGGPLTVSVSVPGFKKYEVANAPNLSELTEIVDHTVGKDSGYLSDIFISEEIDKLNIGESYVIAAPVGCGKTTALIDLAVNDTHTLYVFLTNRKASKLQIKKALLEKMHINTNIWSDEAILHASTGNVIVMTYQELSIYDNPYGLLTNKTLILDEIHCLKNDATFSDYTAKIYDILKALRPKTRRIYISATIDEVVEKIFDIEKVSDNKSFLYAHEGDCYIEHLYIMESNWEHISVTAYKTSDIDALTEKLNKDSEQGKKSIVFVQRKSSGKIFLDKLNDSSMVYASDYDDTQLDDIAINERFENSSLISTKVLENGTSIVDDSIKNIVIEETDPVSFMQFLGRVRTKRNNPRHINLYVPDYSISELCKIRSSHYDKLKVIKRVINNPNSCLRNYESYRPYVYYSGTEPKANMLAYAKFNNMINHLDNLIEEIPNEPHAYLKSILKLLCLPDEIQDCMFLDYDDIAAFKSGVRKAYDEFIQSPKLKADRDKLAKGLIKITSSTNVYPKKTSGNQLQIDKINDILKCAGIDTAIRSLGEAFDIE